MNFCILTEMVAIFNEKILGQEEFGFTAEGTEKSSR